LARRGPGRRGWDGFRPSDQRSLATPLGFSGGLDVAGQDSQGISLTGGWCAGSRIASGCIDAAARSRLTRAADGYRDKARCGRRLCSRATAGVRDNLREVEIL
jgi:hypothetical protein